jgi:hypothetical protein
VTLLCTALTGRDAAAACCLKHQTTTSGLDTAIQLVQVDGVEAPLDSVGFVLRAIDTLVALALPLSVTLAQRAGHPLDHFGIKFQTL